ncbi:MAG TPA: response regulator [Mucilaginibacter sp.]
MTAETVPVRICLIDNDPVYTFGFKKIISSKTPGNQFINFSNGAQALTWLKNPFYVDILPDVIFLDINMPVMDGWEFMRGFAEIKPQLGKKITIYIISSSIDLNDIYMAKNISDITDYIFKPVSESQFNDIIANLPGGNDIKFTASN